MNASEQSQSDNSFNGIFDLGRRNGGEISFLVESRRESRLMS
jgi:hypothetical protein